MSTLGVIGAVAKLLWEVIQVARKLFADNPEKFILDTADTFKRLRQAKTSEERVNAGKAIQDLLKRL